MIPEGNYPNVIRKRMIYTTPTNYDSNVVIPVSRNYQRITTYGFDPRLKHSDGHDKDTAYDSRLTDYGLRLTDLHHIPRDKPC